VPWRSAPVIAVASYRAGNFRCEFLSWFLRISQLVFADQALVTAEVDSKSVAHGGGLVRAPSGPRALWSLEVALGPDTESGGRGPEGAASCILKRRTNPYLILARPRVRDATRGSEVSRQLAYRRCPRRRTATPRPR
jgi:hypothetical protein